MSSSSGLARASPKDQGPIPERRADARPPLGRGGLSASSIMVQGKQTVLSALLA